MENVHLRLIYALAEIRVNHVLTSDGPTFYIVI